jgi:hypothetical protein
MYVYTAPAQPRCRFLCSGLFWLLEQLLPTYSLKALQSQAPLACSNKRIDAAADRHAVCRALVMLAFPFVASCCASTSTMATLKLHSRHLQQ